MEALAGTSLLFLAIVLWHRWIEPIRGGHREWTRRLLAFAPLLVFVVAPPSPPPADLALLQATAIALGGAVLLWSRSIGMLRSQLALAASGLQPLSRRDAGLIVLNLVAGPLVQEPIYRGAMLWPLAMSIGPLPATVVTSSLFVLEHRVHPSAARWFHRNDYIKQFALGSLFGVASIAAGSLVPALIGHLAFNGPPLAVLLLRMRAGGDPTADSVPPEVPAGVLVRREDCHEEEVREAGSRSHLSPGGNADPVGQGCTAESRT